MSEPETVYVHPGYNEPLGDLSPLDPMRDPVHSKEADFVVAHHAVGAFQRGDRITANELGSDNPGLLVSLGAIIPLFKPEAAPKRVRRAPVAVWDSGSPQEPGQETPTGIN